jgi:uncharacterized protein (TIGR00251 family)
LNLTLAVRDGVAGATFAVRVSPRAGKTAITGILGEGADAVLKIALAAPPVDGRANEALIAYLAGLLGVARSEIAIVSGEQSRNKRIRVKGSTAEQVRSILDAIVV